VDLHAGADIVALYQGMLEARHPAWALSQPGAFEENRCA